VIRSADRRHSDARHLARSALRAALLFRVVCAYTCVGERDGYFESNPAEPSPRELRSSIPSPVPTGEGTGGAVPKTILCRTLDTKTGSGPRRSRGGHRPEQNGSGIFMLAWCARARARANVTSILKHPVAVMVRTTVGMAGRLGQNCSPVAAVTAGRVSPVPVDRL